MNTPSFSNKIVSGLELEVSLKLMNDKLHFTGHAGDKEPVNIDYIPPLGDNMGTTSLELLLMSLSSCLASTVLPLLRRMKKTINGCEVKASGIRRDEHPTCFKNIDLELIIQSPDVLQAEVEKW